LKNTADRVYKYCWFDCAIGSGAVGRNVTVAGGDQRWDKPGRNSSRLAVYIERVGGL
jgi:hypothetical protein